MKWVTWENIGVDRMGCAWLIKRFLDPQAEFAFVPAGQERLPEGYEAFDIPGQRYSHRGGHCSFHTLLAEHRLHDRLLQRIAAIIDEADTAQELALESVAPGLDFICRGIRLVSPDDATALERGATVYDALYAQLKSEAGG